MTRVLFSCWPTANGWSANAGAFVEALRPLIPPDAHVLMLPYTYAERCSPETYAETYGRGGRHDTSAVAAFAQWGIAEEQIDRVDALRDGRETVADKLARADILFFPGGRPEAAVAHIDALGLREAIAAHPGVMMGYSAGALLQMTEYIITPDEDDPELIYARGLGLVDTAFHIEVHYEPSPESDALLQAIANETRRPVYAMGNEGAILLTDHAPPRFIGDVTAFVPQEADAESNADAEADTSAGSGPVSEPETKPPTPAKKRNFAEARHAFLRGKHAVSPSATILVALIYTLLLLSRLIDAAFLDRDSQYLSIILLQLLIFPIPAYLYIRLKPRGFAKSLRLSVIRLSHLFLLLSGILVLVTGCTLLGLICGMMNAQPSFTLYDTFASINDGTVGAWIRLILAYGLLPAFCEELVFRGILCAEHERHGILYASVVSALFFAFLHFDLTALPVYLFAGILLSLVMYVTRSTVAAMVVHLGYNLFGIFVQAGLSGYCRSTGSIGLLVVLLMALLLLSSALFCGEVARILHRRAKTDLLDDPSKISTPGLNRLAPREWPRALLAAFASPAGVFAVVLWLFGVVMNLVR